jgi:butyryl-CoA dehydrogenase
MDFRLTKEQDKIKQTIKDFADKEIAPLCTKYDELQEIPAGMIARCREMGLFGLLAPKEYGGKGVDSLTLIVAIEEISKVSASVGVMLSVQNSLVIYPIMQFGTRKQKEKYLPKLASGEIIGCLGLTEADAGSDAAAIKTTARRTGDLYLVKGGKMFITNGHISDLMITFAKTKPDAGSKGISCFILEKSMDGFESGKKLDKMGIRMSDTTPVILNNVPVPRDNLLGDLNNGFTITMDTLNRSRLGIAAQALGIAQAALDESLTYSKKRVQFGKTISEFQAIQWMLAEVATNLRAARLSVYDAAWRIDNDLPFIMEASMAKLLASKIAVEAADRAVQIHGGYGLLKSFKVERLYRDAKVTEIYEGTSEIQKLLIARHLIGKKLS